MKRLLALVSLLSACGVGGPATRVSLAPVADAPPASAYVDQIKKWTRHGHVFSDFDETLTVDATLHSPEFRAAYVERWISVYKIAPEDAARLRADWNKEIADMWELHVESSGHDFNVNNFTANKTPWRLVLTTDAGRDLTPSEVQSSKMRREVEVDLYPYATLFSRGWRVRFPRKLADGTPLLTADTRSLTFRISGPAGSTDLTWTLR
jgi:hypothetical protein